MANLTILDIGHGNCSVLRDERGTVIIDAGLGETLLEFLEQGAVTEIDVVLVSHADADHIAGIVTLLSQRHITIGTLYLNTDTLRRTTMWNAFRVALRDARMRLATSVHMELTTETSIQLHRGNVRLEVLAPTPEVAASGAGGRDMHDRLLSANAMSAVIRIVSNGTPEVLLPGDVDGTGLENLLAEYPEPHARVLVFPHHGARPGQSNPFDFAERRCRAVRPDVVVFSIGRGKHGTPLPEIVRGVRTGAPNAHIACTQLSEWCAASLPTNSPTQLGRHAAKGRAVNACCAGSLELTLTAEEPVYAPALAEHRAFVVRHAPTALCIGRGVLAGGSG